MARTHRRLTPRIIVPDGKAQTMRGLDRCPPANWRKHELTRPERREGAYIEHLARTCADLEALPVVGRVARPWFT